jgi:catechol 2,3-dioxygenase-like lactoylglutathione lyase family enzyme
MLRPKALDHVGLKVDDLDQTLYFYQALGLELLRVTGPKSDGSRIAVLRVGAQELNVFSAPGASAVQAASERIDHFCLEMEAASPEALAADLRHAGIEVVRGPIARREGKSFFVLDPDGVRVELLLKQERG